MNPKKSQWIWSAGGVALALGAGVMIGRISAPEGDKSANGSGSASARSSERGGSDGRFGTAGNSRGKDKDGRAASAKSIDSNIKAIFESTSRLDRTQRLLAFLDRLPPEQFAAVYDEFRNMPGVNLRGSERTLILQAWAEKDPHSALAFLQDKGGEDWERETTVATWAANDPQGAFAWASTAEDEGNVNNWLLGATRGIAAADPELARDFLAQLEGETRNQALNAMQPYVMQYGADYAMNWLSGLGDEAMRNQASRSMARDIANLDPAKAAQWNGAMTNVELRRDISETVSERWARQDLAAARAWVERLPEDTRTEAAEGIAGRWAREDPAAAAKWLTGLGNNPDLDGARTVFIEQSFRSSPQASLEFVANLSDRNLQERYYQRNLGAWIQQDENAARRWLANNAQSLPPRIVQRFNNPGNRPRQQ